MIELTNSGELISLLFWKNIMKLTFNPSQCFSVPKTLYDILNTELSKVTLPQKDTTGITFSFRDPDFSEDDGGFQPVNIRVIKSTSNNYWDLEHITDFSFQGLPHPELVKDINVCFITEKVYTGYVGLLSTTAGKELFEIFIENFIGYLEMGIFDVEIFFD